MSGIVGWCVRVMDEWFWSLLMNGFIWDFKGL